MEVGAPASSPVPFSLMLVPPRSDPMPRVDEAVKEVESFELECLEVGKKVADISIFGSGSADGGIILSLRWWCWRWHPTAGWKLFWFWGEGVGEEGDGVQGLWF
ncbi:Hypothetical predicted protein [Olea europaea subsp. europaea]|uniref:Uncharacterized protein n=1 Tax=Olea europaea subsp. europaea TaxID=158383 RepID=A0A8S0QA27_OLEEU|nr:Hypothetical predicted protein [Olea europaea subsp. europaea]